MIGEIVDGHQILRPLGAGGMGAVYLAQSPTGSQRALKVVRTDDDAGTQAAARFRREVLALGKLRHPNIVEILDAGRLASGALYLAMEYVPGPDLQSATDRHGPYPIGDTLAILIQLASALAYAHAAGVVHRDLKPPNVILVDGNPERVKIIDFGLAKIASEHGLTRLTEDQQVLGSPLYWAPEQSTDANVGPEADIYALGGIAYYALSGAPIFASRPSVALVYAHQYENPQLLSRRCSATLPPGFDELIARCVAKHPGDRPTAAELVGILEDLRAMVPSEQAPRRRRLFSDAGAGDLAQALTSQMRQVLLDLACEVEIDTTAIDHLQTDLSELELELAMLESDLETSIDDRAELAARHADIADRVISRRSALVEAFRALYDDLATHRGCSSAEANELFAELDDLDAQYQAV